MRSSISAQSCASVPPAPEWIETTASPASYSPLKSASSWSRSSSLPERLELRLDVVGEVGLELEQLGGVVVLALEPLVALEALREPGVLGRDGGRAGLVVPEARLPQLLLELGDAGRYGVRVKGNHEPRRAGL